MCNDDAICKDHPTLVGRIVNTTHKAKEAQILRTYIFLLILKKDATCKADTDIVVEAMKRMKQIKNVGETRIYEAFSRRKVCLAWEQAGALMVSSYAEANTVVATEDKPMCIICVEKRSDYLCVHGQTAHGGFCGSCALRVVLEAGRRCPMCSQRVKLICVRSSSRAARLQIFDP